MTPEHRLVVPLTGQGEDTTVIRYANALARLHAGAGRIAAKRRRPPADQPESRGPVAVDEEEGLMLSAPGTVEFVDLSSERAIEQLLALAGDPGTAAVVVGEAVGRRFCQRLVQRGACSIWFVPDGAVPDLGRILIPVDFSVRAADCLRVGTSLAQLSAAECLALHVYFNDSPHADAAMDRAEQARVAAAYARFAAPIDTLGVPVSPVWRECSSVANAINRAATELDADLVILASRGRTWAGALFHESVAETTLRECRVPLLVLKHFGAQRGLLALLRDPAQGHRNNLRFN